MDIETLFAQKHQQANGKSFAFLTERCPHSKEHPFGIKPASPIMPEDVVVLVLAGEISENHNDAMRQYNGFLKRTEQYINTIPEFKDKNIRIITPIIDFGNYYDAATSRDILHTTTQKKNYDLSRFAKITQQEYTMPSYVQDIFNGLYLPRIKDEKHPIRRPLQQALRNIRRITTVAYCHGGYTALKLEELLKSNMENLAYSTEEQQKILQQNLVVAYSADCPLGISQSRFISISSASDLHCRHSNVFKDFLHFRFDVPDFGICYLPASKGEAFYCAQYNKAGVEGTPKIITVKKIGQDDNLSTLTKELSQKEKENLEIREHDFLGYTLREGMSNQAKDLMKFGKNIIKNGIKNSLLQKDTGFTPLPKTYHLAANNLSEYLYLGTAALLGHRLWKSMNKYGKDYILKNSFSANLHYLSID